MCCHLFDQRYAAPFSGDFRRRPSPLKACGLSWRNGFLPILQRGLRHPFIKKNKKKINLIFFHYLKFYLLSSNSNSCFLSEKPFYQYVFEGLPRPFKRHFLMNLRAYYLNCFQLNLYFGVLAQKYLKSCVNGVLKFQFFFLNLSSKVLAGVIVRTSKYPYMDICDDHCLICMRAMETNIIAAMPSNKLTVS